MECPYGRLTYNETCYCGAKGVEVTYSMIDVYCDPRHESRKYFQCPYYQEKEQGISDLKKGFVGGVKNGMRATVLIFGSFIAICVFGWLYMTVRSHLGLSKTHAVYTLAPSEGCTVDTSELELRLVPRVMVV